jgi:hypothetical protein
MNENRELSMHGEPYHYQTADLHGRRAADPLAHLRTLRQALHRANSRFKTSHSDSGHLQTPDYCF